MAFLSEPTSPGQTGASSYEAVIKVNRADEPWKRGRDIAEGLHYACALLMDEYEWTAEGIASELERITDELYDEEAQRGSAS